MNLDNDIFVVVSRVIDLPNNIVTSKHAGGSNLLLIYYLQIVFMIASLIF